MSLSVLTCWIATLLWNKALNSRTHYELVPDYEQGFSEDLVNIVESLTEAPNQSSEIFDTPAPSPAQEGKPRCITQYFKLLHLYSFILIYMH
jgi:hypothetical protein